MTLCEREADAEQVFAYLQTAVEAGDRAGANACADAYLELAPRGAHVREANELVASMPERQAPATRQAREETPAGPVRSQPYVYERRLPRRPIYFFSVSAGLQWQRIRSLGADLNIGPLIAIGGGGKVSLVEENEFQLAVVIGGQGSLGRVEPNSSSSEFIFETGLNVGMQLDAAAGEPAFLMRVLYSPTVGGIWNSCSLGRCDGPLLRLLAYQIVIGVRTARDASVSAAWAHSLEPNPFASVRVETMALSAQADFLF